MSSDNGVYMGSRSSLYLSDGVELIVVLAALLLTVLAFIFIIPEKRRQKLGGFFSWLHGVFNFKKLLIESIFKFFYVFSTIFIIADSIAMFFWMLGKGENVLPAVLLLILGPIALRIMYELIMMFILLVNNVIAINNKLPLNGKANNLKAAPAKKICPNCGAELNDGDTFCTSCGTALK